MKTLFIECNMGAAGDMLTAALSELLESDAERESFFRQMNGLGLENVRVSAEPSVKHGIRGTHVSVTVGGIEENEHIGEHRHGHHSHAGINDIERILKKLPVSRTVKDNALAVYNLIAEAESHAHGRPVTEIHFHEVGNSDAVADISGVCLLMEKIAPERVVVSPVHVGSGTVHCAHGVLPVPAPATARILRDVPIYGGNISGELCTPTGAALLKHFAESFGGMPLMRTEKIGYGMGSKDFETANCIRVFLGESENENAANEEVAELCCNIDDMTGEQIAFATQTLMRAGALDVFTTPVQMKKNRPGVLITCLCAVKNADNFAELMLKHTSTFGVRKSIHSRYILKRDIVRQDTPLGQVRVKIGEGYGVRKTKLEYEDIAEIARKSEL